MLLHCAGWQEWYLWILVLTESSSQYQELQNRAPWDLLSTYASGRLIDEAGHGIDAGRQLPALGRQMNRCIPLAYQMPWLHCCWPQRGTPAGAVVDLCVGRAVPLKVEAVRDMLGYRCSH